MNFMSTVYPTSENSIAGGTTHDSWSAGSGLVFGRAEKAYKWDESGKCYTDFWMGHGALILGHNHAAVTEAIVQQLKRGTHISGNHSGLIQWSKKIVELLPSAESVRFCSSGTEATLLAMRIARAYTGRSDIVRIDGHFHGWHDESLSGVVDGWPVGGHPLSAAHLHVIPPYDTEQLTSVLSENNVAAVILEPGGGSSGTLPMDVKWLSQIREETEKHGSLLIFDEVMSGFRYAPGGVQSLAGVRPDITTLSKVLCGGLPGAAVAGTGEVMNCFNASHPRKVVHSGTFNGNPLSASAGLTTLNIISDGLIQKEITAKAVNFVNAVNHLAERHNVDIRLFNQSSIFHLMIGSQNENIEVCPSENAFYLIHKYDVAYQKLQQLMLNYGIDMHKSHGWLSYSHTDDVLEEACHKFEAIFKYLRKNNETGIPLT